MAPGDMAHSSCLDSNMLKARSGFTLIEMLVVVAIIGLLVGILAPSLSAARRVSKATKCKANLHDIGIGMKAYLDVNRDTFPWAARMPSPLHPQSGQPGQLLT